MAAIIGQRITQWNSPRAKGNRLSGGKMGNLKAKRIHRYFVSFSIPLSIARGDV